MDKTQEIRDRLEELVALRSTVLAKADTEGRDLTSEEQQAIDGYSDEFKAQNADLSRRLELEADMEALRTPQNRKTAPDQVTTGPEDEEGDDDADETPARSPKMTTRRPATREPARAVDTTAKNKWGWQSFGDFARGVRMACAQGGRLDQRLSVRMAPTEYANEGSGADGGFAVPPDFRTAIMQMVMGEDSLLARTDDYTTSGNTFTAPMDSTTPWGTTGIQAYWTAEGAQKSQSKPVLDQVSVRLNKLAALVPVTDELLEDAPALDTYLRRKVPQVMDYKVSLAILQGTGVGQPLGIVNSPGTVSVAKEGSQTADTINRANIDNMWNRLIASSRQNAVWITSQDVEAELQNLFWKAETADTSGVPLYMPSGGLSASPYSTLKGRPVLMSEAAAALGDKGDLILADLTKYLSVRKTAGPRADVSIHLWFDYDVTAFRFVFRVGGQPWWNAPVTSANGTERSAFVTLDERA